MDKGEWAAARLATLRLVELHGQLGEADRAREMLADWVEREPNDAAALRMLAEMNVASEQWEQAAAAFTRLIELEQGEAQLAAALRLAEACEKLGRPADARDGLEAVYKRNPDAEPLRAHLRRLYEHAGAHQELAELYLADAQHAPDDATRFDRLRRAGELLLTGVNDATAAVEPLERALKIRAGDHDALALLADAYLGAGRVQEATNLLEGGIAAHKNRRSPQLAQLQYRMARCAAAAGDRNIELAWLNVALDSDMQNGQVASELADVAFEFGQTEVALKALRAVTLMKAPGPMTRAMAFLRQGMIAQQQGDARKAIFLAKKALAEDPNLSDASSFLRELGE
jgi:tetratricopeptide (TPR) repeat protein